MDKGLVNEQLSEISSDSRNKGEKRAQETASQQTKLRAQIQGFNVVLGTFALCLFTTVWDNNAKKTEWAPEEKAQTRFHGSRGQQEVARAQRLSAAHQRAHAACATACSCTDALTTFASPPRWRTFARTRLRWARHKQPSVLLDGYWLLFTTLLSLIRNIKQVRDFFLAKAVTHLHTALDHVPYVSGGKAGASKRQNNSGPAK